jgi:hypothetical protein
LVDSTGQPVGFLTDAVNGTALARFGNDWLAFASSPIGFGEVEYIDFYHTEPNCQGERYLYNFNGVGFVYMAHIMGTTAFYTRFVDPSGTASTPVASYEHVLLGSDPQQPGACTDFGGQFPLPVGPVVSTDLGSFVPPFQIQ